MAKLNIGQFGKLATPVTAKNGNPLTIAEFIAFDANNEKTIKDILDSLIEAIEQGGGSGGDVTINDEMLGAGLVYENNKINLNINDSLKIDNNKLSINISSFSGLIVDTGDSAGVKINAAKPFIVGETLSLLYNTDHFELSGTNKELSLKLDTAYFTITNKGLALIAGSSGGSSGSYTLPEAAENVLGGVYLNTSIPPDRDEVSIIPIGKKIINNKSVFGLIVRSDGEFKTDDNILNIDPKWLVDDVYHSNDYSALVLGTAVSDIVTNINVKTIWGTKEDCPGPRTIYFDEIDVSTDNGWPVTGKVSGHLVVNKSFPTDASRYTHSQMLYITNGTGNDYKIFMRDGEGGYTDEGHEFVTTWRPWKELQGMTILNGSGEDGALISSDLNNVIDNGLYAGVYQKDDFAIDESNGNITGMETFFMIVVNNYVMSAALSKRIESLSLYIPKQIVQYKISSPVYELSQSQIDAGASLDPSLYKGKVEMRTGVYNMPANEWKFTEWESAGGSIVLQ